MKIKKDIIKIGEIDKKPLSTDVTMRVMIIVGEIMMLNKRNNGPYKNYRAIAESLHCSYTVFSQYGDSSRNVTIEMICWLHINHGVNLNWLATGKGERYHNQDVAARLLLLEERMSEAELKIGIKPSKIK